jgi:biotin operon repressor
MQNKILEFMQDSGNWLSYQTIAENLDIHRLTVRKYVQILENKGKVASRRIHSRRCVWKAVDDDEF